MKKNILLLCPPPPININENLHENLLFSCIDYVLEDKAANHLKVFNFNRLHAYLDLIICVYICEWLVHVSHYICRHFAIQIQKFKKKLNGLMKR